MSENALKEYNEKRNFKQTQEPVGKAARKRKKDLRFTVQKHDATQLHYDFRLEWQGVLLSWAVPKGPSYCPKDKRLAVRTEDHPLSYWDFEGTIPAKEYGGGLVMLWDTGEWQPLDDDPDKALKKGKLTFRLSGHKLKGEWTLARMSRDQTKENWLLIKKKDEEARDTTDKAYLTKTDYSVKSGREFEAIADAEQSRPSSQSKNSTSLTSLQKKYHSPQLATLVNAPPDGDNWVHEVKYDGYRVLVFFKDGKVKIRTRNGHDWTDKFPNLKQAFEALESEPFVIDGEVVIINDQGLSDFKALQNAFKQKKAPLRGYFFDLLYWDGEDYSQKNFRRRRQALEKLFESFPDSPLYLSEIVEGKAETIIDKACELDLEGIISKKADARYVQERSKYWLKSKCQQRQEFIICGFDPSKKSSKAIGALHLGFYQNDKLTYAGKVGTGFTEQLAFDLYKTLKPLARKSPPFNKKPAGSFKTTVWTKPETLCEVQFANWTRNGKVRHASFQGVRSDKDPRKIIQEQPAPVELTQKGEAMSQIEVVGVMISHADRQIFPEARVNKGELVLYYEALGKHILAALKNRPVSIVRCPGGIDHQCFFQRSKGKGMPRHIHTITLSHQGKSHDYIYIKNLTGLIELTQMGSIELHPWGATIDKIEKPDRIVFDLDPDEGVPFEAVKLAAQDIHNRLSDLGLESFLKCTGGKGLHITVPIQRRKRWDTVKDFARNFAQQMVNDVPEAYTLNLSKRQRKGKIFIDYLRNDYASTAVVDYCVRARPGAAVATPLYWEELEDLNAANQFTITDILERQAQNKLFVYPDVQQNLTKQILKEVG